MPIGPIGSSPVVTPPSSAGHAAPPTVAPPASESPKPTTTLALGGPAAGQSASGLWGAVPPVPVADCALQVTSTVAGTSAVALDAHGHPKAWLAVAAATYAKNDTATADPSPQSLLIQGCQARDREEFPAAAAAFVAAMQVAARTDQIIVSGLLGADATVRSGDREGAGAVMMQMGARLGIDQDPEGPAAQLVAWLRHYLEPGDAAPEGPREGPGVPNALVASATTTRRTESTHRPRDAAAGGARQVVVAGTLNAMVASFTPSVDLSTTIFAGVGGVSAGSGAEGGAGATSGSSPGLSAGGSAGPSGGTGSSAGSTSGGSSGSGA